MAFLGKSCFSSSILILIISTICLMILTTTTDGTTTALDEICQDTLDPILCIEVIGGDRYASLEGAAEVGFLTAGVDSISNKNVFTRILNKSSSGSLFIELAGQCEQKYDHIFKDFIIPGHEAMRVGRWEDVKSPINQIPAVVDECEELWDYNSPAHDDSRKVKVASQAIVVIAKVKTQ